MHGELFDSCEKFIVENFSNMQEENAELNEELNVLTYKVIGLAIEVHRELGPGLLESAFLECLFYELRNAGLKAERQVALPIIYKDIKLDHGYRIDLLVNDQLVIELKTVETFTDVHSAQVLTYLKLGNYPIGLLMNFHSKMLKNNIKRFLNKPL